MKPLVMVLLLSGGAALAQEADPAAARYLAGEIIVKFADSTPAAAALRRTGGDAAEDPALVGYVDEVGDSLSLPLLIRRVTSGAEVLLAIDVRKLVDGAVERTRGCAGVADARVPRAGGDPPPAGVYEVRFAAGSPEAAALAAARAADTATDARLDEVVGGLARELGLPLGYRVGDGDALKLTVDLEAVAESAAERLRQLPEVLYVELNQLLEPMM
jgi:hypothetical protein